MLWIIGFIMLILLIKMPVPKINQSILQESSGTSRSMLPLSEKVIVIDPGHGGPDGGAVGKDDTNEKEIALIVAKQLRNYLQQAGALVYLTREKDEDLASEDTVGLSKRKSEDIRNRLNLIHDKDADFFISIHLNAVPSSRWRGAQTFFYPENEESEQLASMIQTAIKDNLQNTDREHLPIHTVYLLKHAEVPGALVEIGFLSNNDERELLKQRDYQRRMAASIYEGIIRYIVDDGSDDTSGN